MKLTCAQMDVLISFYLEGDLSTALKKRVEEHMQACATCRAKFDIIKSMISDLKKCCEVEKTPSQNDLFSKPSAVSQQYRIFKTDLSAYIDNELSSDENIKIKKITINNPKARQDLQDNYNMRKIMKDSFDKTKSEMRQDFSRSVLRQLELEDDANYSFNPVIKILISFTVLVLVLTSIVLISLQV